MGEEAVAIAVSGDHAYSRFQAFFGLGILHLTRGRPDRAVPALEQGLVLARIENIPFFAFPSSRLHSAGRTRSPDGSTAVSP